MFAAFIPAQNLNISGNIQIPFKMESRKPVTKLQMPNQNDFCPVFTHGTHTTSRARQGRRRVVSPFWKHRDEHGWHGRIYQLTVFLHFSTSTSQPTVSRVSCRLGTVNRTHVHASQCTVVHFSSLSSDCNTISQIKNLPAVRHKQKGRPVAGSPFCTNASANLLIVPGFLQGGNQFRQQNAF
jgi:hypothetical protein